MTLALHGKSRQRQTLLVLLALLAVGAAIFGGAVVQRADRASAAYGGIGDPTSNPGGFDQCAAPNIMFVIDNSTSINETPGQLTAMINGLNQIVAAVEADLPGTNWAGVRFQRGTGGGDPTVTTTIAGGWEQGNGVTTNITNLINGSVSNGYTPTAAGIQTAIGLGTGPNSQTPLMLIVTDGDPNVTLANAAGTNSTAYINGAIDAVAQAIAARAAGWNTALAYFGGQDFRAEDALGGDYPAYRDAVRNGLAGSPNGPIAGAQIIVGNASGLAAEIIELIRSNCSGSVTINKVLDGGAGVGWDFTASVSGGTANPAGPTYTTDGGGSVSFDVELPSANDTATVSITEDAFDTNTYAFDGATCFLDGQPVGTLTDQTVSGIEVGPGDDVLCTFTNRTLPTTGSITLQKMVSDGQGGWVEDNQDIWDFTIAGQPASNGVAVTGLALEEFHSWTETVPAGWTFVGSYAAGDANGGQCATNPGPTIVDENVAAGETVNRTQYIADNPTDAYVDTLVCVYNEEVPEDGRITIEKYVYNPDSGMWDEHTDATPFTFNIDDSVHQGVGPGTYEVAPGEYIVSEVIDGDEYLFVDIIGGVDECPSSPITVVDDQQTSQVVGDVEVNVEEDADVLVCAYNQPDEGSITIEKYVYNPETETWDAHTEATPFLFDIDDSTHQGVGPGTYTVTPGDYNVSEVLPVAGYEFVALFPGSNAFCPEVPILVEILDEQLFQQLTPSDIDIQVALGEDVLVCAYNEPAEEVLADVNLFVNKFEADDDNAFSGTTGLSGWTINLECLSGDCEAGGFPTSLVTNGGGTASFGAIPFGTYEVCEVPQAGYTVVGSLLDGGSSQAGECRTIEVNEEAAGDDITIVVDFFNHPEAGIRVEKRQLDDGALDVSDNGGWEITVEGCGNTYTQTTNEAIPNSWTFFDVAPCDSYTVSEDPNSKPGYTPVSPTSVNVSVGLGENVLVTFVNDRQTTPTPTPTLPPGTTPTNTPTPVVETPTPVDPTNTPDPEDPTATPTPIDEVEGEITPGASPSPDAAATPIPPASGTGTFGGNAGSSMMMALLAFLMITSGAAVLALGRRGSARN